MAHLRELMDTDIDAAWETLAPVGWGFFTYPASVPVVFWLEIGVRKRACGQTVAQTPAGQSTQDR